MGHSNTPKTALFLVILGLIALIPLLNTPWNDARAQNKTSSHEHPLTVELEPALFKTLTSPVTILLQAPSKDLELIQQADHLGRAQFLLSHEWSGDLRTSFSVAQGKIQYKALSKPLGSYLKNSSAESHSHHAITINALTTAEYAALDIDGDGLLSKIETRSANTHLNRVLDNHKLYVVAAAIKLFTKNGKVKGTSAINSYRLAQRLFANAELYTLVVTQNFKKLNAILKQDYPDSLPLGQFNPDNNHFFRLNQQGKLLRHQNKNYQKLPWACVDDLRSGTQVLRKNGIGIHLWYQHEAQTKAVDASWLAVQIKILKKQKMCGVDGWSIPSIDELKYLYKNKDDTLTPASPHSFPFLTQTYYWVNLDTSQLSLVPAIYDVAKNKLVKTGAKTVASQIYKSWNKLNKPKLKQPQDQSNSEIKAIYKALKALYENPAPSTWPSPGVDEGVAWQPLGLNPKVQHPAHNPYSTAVFELGKKLFFDARLSHDNNISCASCHIPSQGWDDNLNLATGHDGIKGSRNTPGLLNIGLQKSMFWDGRASDLEAQALGPIANPIEMNLPLGQLEKRIAKGSFNDYQPYVKTAFQKDSLTLSHIAKALAQYQRTIQTNNTKFDYFLRGERELSNRETWGLHIFRSKAKCMNCHSGPNFTNNEFEDIGNSEYGRKSEDLGLYLTTKKASDVGKFKVPSLRELLNTAPYMHSGRFKLEESLTAYNNAMGVGVVSNKIKASKFRYDPLFPSGSEKIHVLNLTKAEISALQSFLKTLSTKPDALPIQ